MGIPSFRIARDDVRPSSLDVGAGFRAFAESSVSEATWDAELLAARIERCGSRMLR